MNTTVFCGRSEKPTKERINEYLEIVRLPFWNFPPRFIWFQVQNFKYLSKKLGDYDLLHGVNPQASALCAYFARARGKRFVTTLHEVFARDMSVFINSPISEWAIGDFALNVLEHPINEMMVRTCMKKSDQIITCGRTTALELKRIYPSVDDRKVSIIPNGINLDKIDQIKTENDRRATELTILFFGRLVWRKGILHLVRAMANLASEFRDVNLKILGSGPLRQKIKKLSSDLRMNNRIRMLGHVPYADLIREIKNADIVALPSLYEVGPFIAALESMACKKPLVTFNFPFSREFVTDMQNGVLAKPADVKDLSDRIGILLSSRNLQRKLGENAREYVVQNHNWDLLVKKYIHLYRKTAEQSRLASSGADE